jgi:hypothetical protein
MRLALNRQQAAQQSSFEFDDAPPVHDHGCKRLLRWPMDTATTAVYGNALGNPEPCYRYSLRQTWAKTTSPRMILWLMMNPSGASELMGDSTVIKTGTISRLLGFDGQWIGNVCAWRATDNKRLLKVDDPVGPNNLATLLTMAQNSSLVIVGHGSLPRPLQCHADAATAHLLAHGIDLHVLALSKDGVPVHPLARGKGHIPVTVQPTLWRPGRK